MGRVAKTDKSQRPFAALRAEKDGGTHLTDGCARASSLGPEELLRLFEALHAEETRHLTRLRALQCGLEAERPTVARWLRSIRRLMPAEHLQ